MKRRGFLQMLGGALAAPLVPNASLGAAAKAAYPASALHAAIYHAQTRVSVSAFGLAHVLGLKAAQAEAIMADMSARGILGPIQGAARGGWAHSNVLHRPKGVASAARRLAKGQRPTRAAPQPHPQPTDAEWAAPDIRPLLRHLQKMARDHGFTPNPKCEERAQRFAVAPV